MSFSVSNTTIENYRLVQGLVAPAQPGPSAAVTITIASTGYNLNLAQLGDSKNLNIEAPSDNIDINLPSNVELLNLFDRNPVAGSMVEWNIFNNNSQLKFILPDQDINDSVILSGNSMYKLALQIATGPTDPSGAGVHYDLHNIAYNGSIVMPVPLVQTLTPTTTSINWQFLNASTAYPPSILLKGTLSEPANTLTLTLGTGLSLWQKLFGAAKMPAAGAIYFGNIVIINNSSGTLEFTSSATIELLGVPPGSSITVLQYSVAELKVKFTAKTATSANAQVGMNVYLYTA